MKSLSWSITSLRLVNSLPAHSETSWRLLIKPKHDKSWCLGVEESQELSRLSRPRGGWAGPRHSGVKLITTKIMMSIYQSIKYLRGQSVDGWVGPEIIFFLVTTKIMMSIYQLCREVGLAAKCGTGHSGIVQVFGGDFVDPINYKTNPCNVCLFGFGLLEES